MTHYHVVVLVNPDAENIRGELETLLAPYDEKIKVEPYRVPVDGIDLDIMAQYYHTTDLESLADRMQDWKRCPGYVEEGKLFRESQYNPDSKWDSYRIGGRYDGSLYEIERTSHMGYNHGKQHESLEFNACLVSELPEEIKCYAIVTPTGDWHAIGKMGAFAMSEDHMSHDQWKAHINDLLTKFNQCLAVSVDCHI